MNRITVDVSVYDRESVIPKRDRKPKRILTAVEGMEQNIILSVRQCAYHPPLLPAYLIIVRRRMVSSYAAQIVLQKKQQQKNKKNNNNGWH